MALLRGRTFFGGSSSSGLSLLGGGVSPFRTALGVTRLATAPISDARLFNQPDATAASSRVLDASVPTYPTAFADVRASNATYYNSSGLVTTAASNTQRIDYNPSTLVLRGLLVEPAGTNLALSSGDIWNGAFGWTRNETGTSNNATAPDGTTSATTVTSTGGGANYAYQLFTVTNGATCTFSAYVKAGSGSGFVKLFINDGVNGDLPAWFNVSTGAVGTVNPNIVSTTSQNVGNGWFRFSVTAVMGTTSSDAGFWQVDSDNSNVCVTGHTQLWWGGQFELGSVPSSYIETTTASATRAADSISFTLNASATQLTFTFDDLSTQIVTGLTGGSTYTIPTNLNRPWILYIDDDSAGIGSVSASLAATEAADTAAFAVTETINAALAATEAQDTAAIVASVGDNAALAVTEAQDIALINTTESDVAVLAATEAKDTAALAVSVGDNAALAATEAQDVASIAASVGDNAALAATEAKDVALINASESDVAVLAATEAPDAAAFIVIEIDNAALAATEAADVAAVTVTVGATIAVLAATENQDVLRFSVAVTEIVIPPDPRPSLGLRRIYPAAGVPGIYNADIFGGGTPAITPDFSSGDFSGDFARTGTPTTAGSGASIYGAAGALNKPLRRTTGPQMRRTYKYPVQLIPGGIYDKDIYGQNIYQSDS